LEEDFISKESSAWVTENTIMKKKNTCKPASNNDNNKNEVREREMKGN
jgi:hypothetical protein